MDEFELADSIFEELSPLVGHLQLKIPVKDIFTALILCSSIKEAALALDITDSTLEHILSRSISKCVGKPPRVKWDTYLLSTVFLKKCYKCDCIQDVDNFGLDSSNFWGLAKVCRSCDNARSKVYRQSNLEATLENSKRHYRDNKSAYLYRNSLRRAKKLKATPCWADLDKIKEFYSNRPSGYHVDHIIPLQGTNVCGLHVEHNLQYLPAKENLSKSNTFTV